MFNKKRQRSNTPAPKRARSAVQRLLLVGFSAIAFCGSAHALRPFQGTDASVAEQGSFELEAGVAQVRDPQGRTFSVPELVGNWGIWKDTELVLEGKIGREHLSETRNRETRLTDTALSLKHVWVPGALQDGTGFSVATECGVLLPEVNGASGFGATCAGIASNRWNGVELHLNAALTRTREHTTARELSVIVEAPEEWKYRPVVEATSSHNSNGDWSRTALVGLIYRVDEDLALDAGYRRGHGSDGNFNELRAGLTWTFGAAK